MNEDATNHEDDWQPLLESRSWNALENWWQEWVAAYPDATAPLKALLAALEEIVPKITVENGMERLERHIKCSDPEDVWQGREHIKGAAKILELGELEAAAEMEPPTAKQIWSEQRSE